MVLDALRGYVQMASGLTEVNRQKAVTEAKALLAQRGVFEQVLAEQAKGFADDVGRQVQTLADELVATSKANRQILVSMIRTEVERAVASLGLATSEELSVLRRRVERLDQKVSGTEPARSGSTARSATKKATATKTGAAKKPAAKKSTAKKSAAAPTAASKENS